jgi:hypothetical protein
MTKRLLTPIKNAAVPPQAGAPLPARSRASRLVAGHVDLEAMPDQPFAEGRGSEIDPDLRHRMISEAAYHLYVGRGYADGGDLEDWLQAEAAIDHYLLNPSQP